MAGSSAPLLLAAVGVIRRNEFTLFCSSKMKVALLMKQGAGLSEVISDLRRVWHWQDMPQRYCVYVRAESVSRGDVCGVEGDPPEILEKLPRLRIGTVIRHLQRQVADHCRSGGRHGDHTGASAAGNDVQSAGDPYSSSSICLALDWRMGLLSLISISRNCSA